MGDIKADAPVELAIGINLLDAVFVDEYGAADWTIVASRADGHRVLTHVVAVHDGTTDADATGGTYEEYGRVWTSKAADKQLILGVQLTGEGFEQRLRLLCTITSAWWKAHIFRAPIVGSGRTS
jgi:hypothetical protein